MASKTILFFLLLFSLLLSQSVPAADWLIYGTVSWDSKTTAASVKMRLLQGAKEKKTVYSNPQGRYGFYDLPGNPADYTLQLWFNNKLLKTIPRQKMNTLERGGKLDIRLQRKP